MVECFACAATCRIILGRDGEQAGRLIEGHIFYRGVEANVLAYIRLLYAALNIVPQDFTGRIGRDRLLEMFVEGVVGELKTLLGTVRPQIPVHTAVNRLAVFIYAGAPSIVPHAAPVLLLFEADDVGDIGSL